MNEKIKLNISSKFDCLVCGKEEIFLTANYSRVEMLFDLNEYFFVYPIKEGISYVVKIENGKLQENSKIEVKHLFENEYEVILNPYELYCLPGKIESKTSNNFKQSIIFGSPVVYCLEKGDVKNFCTLDSDLKSYEFLTLKNLPLLKIQKKDEQELIFFEDESQTFKSLKGEVDIVGDEITLVTPLFDTSHRAKVCKYIVKDGSIKKTDEDLIYLDGFPIYPKEEGVIPYAFFEAIQCKDFLYANELLSDELKQSVSPEVLQNYFGDFEKIKFYNYSKQKGHFVCLLGKEENNVYRLLLKNKKIAEIERFLQTNGIDTYE